MGMLGGLCALGLTRFSTGSWPPGCWPWDKEPWVSRTFVLDLVANRANHDFQTLLMTDSDLVRSLHYVLTCLGRPPPIHMGECHRVHTRCDGTELESSGAG
jgi:hypothetical protein